jgi:hypothetical protein
MNKQFVSEDGESGRMVEGGTRRGGFNLSNLGEAAAPVSRLASAGSTKKDANRSATFTSRILRLESIKL